MGQFSKSPDLIIRRLIEASRRAVDPGQSPPLKAPAAFPLSTAVVVGQVFAANGNWYVVVVAGTTSGTSPSHTNGQSVTNGTAQLQFVGPALITVDDASAPTVTTQNTTPAGLTNFYQIASDPVPFLVYRGGYAITNAGGTNGWLINSFNEKAATQKNLDTSIEFITDAPKFAIGFGNNVQLPRVIVDGRYVVAGAQTLVFGAQPTWAIYDFGTVRKRRRVIVEKSDGYSYQGVRVDPLSKVWRPPVDDDLTAYFIADSMGAGSSFGPTVGSQGRVPYRFGKRVGIQNIYNASRGGTGWVNTGGGYYTYRDRVAEGLLRNPDVWIFWGSTNDSGQSGIDTAVAGAIADIRAGGSRAPIVIFGCWGTVTTGSPNVSNSGLAAVEAAIQTGITAAGDKLTFFAPMIGAPEGSWITGLGYASAEAGDGNADIYISNDAGVKVHPPSIGSDYQVDRLADAWRNRILTAMAAL